MAEPEVHKPSALYDQEADETGHAQAWRAHTRDIVPDDDSNVIDMTQRSRARIESQLPERWGKPIEEPPPAASKDPDAPARNLRDGLSSLPSWKGPSPSLRAIWHDMCEGSARTYETSGLPMTLAYWVFGAPGFVICCISETTKIANARSGRTFGWVVIVLILWGALAVAGLNPF